MWGDVMGWLNILIIYNILLFYYSIIVVSFTFQFIMDKATEVVKKELLDALKRKESIVGKLVMVYLVYYRFKQETNDTGDEAIYLYMDKLILQLLDIYITNHVRKCKEYGVEDDVMKHNIVQCWFSKDYEMVNDLIEYV